MVSINSNPAALSAQQNIKAADSQLRGSMQRMSSGNRIDRAATDVAGLAVGTQLQANVSILKAALGNTSQANSMLGVADGALKAIGDILQRQASLALQARSGALDAASRSFLNQEFQGLSSEIDRLADATNFNGIKLINGDLYAAGGVAETDVTKTENTSILEITFGNNYARSYNLFGTGGIATAMETMAVGAASDVNVAIADHPFSSSSVITVTGDGQAGGLESGAGTSLITTANISTFAMGSVVDEDNIILTATTAAAGVIVAGGDGGGTEVESLGIRLTASAAKSYDLLAGDTLDINGFTFTAVNKDYVAPSSTQIGTSTEQTSAELATAVEDAIKRAIDNKASGYEKLLGVTVERNGASLKFTTKSAGATSENFYVKPGGTLGGGGKITGGVNGNTGIGGTGRLKATGGGYGALTTMNTKVTGTVKDSLVKSLNTSATPATASFTVAANPTTTFGSNGNEFSIAAGAIATNGTSTSLTVTLAGHGFVNGEKITFDSAIALADANSQTSSGLTAGAGEYTVRVVDQDTFEIYGANLSGTFSGIANTSSAIEATEIVDYGDRLNVNGKVYKFVSSLTGNGQEILIGANATATAKNILQVLNNDEDSRVALATYSINLAGSDPVITATLKGNATASQVKFTLGEAAGSSALTITDSIVTGGTVDNGVDTLNITNNDAFVGVIQGFKATYVSNNKADVSVKVGDYTYTANEVPTQNTSDTWVTFVADDAKGGYFKVQLAASEGQAVANQTDADTFAARLNKAFSELEFTQRREVTSFEAAGDVYTGSVKTGSLSGAKIFATLDSFNEMTIEDIKFTTPTTGDSKITMTINGQAYSKTITSSATTLYKGSLVTLTSEADSSKKIDLVVGNYDLTIDTADKADAATAAYREALGLNETGNSGVSFQVGSGESDKINVQIKGAKTSDIYRDESGTVQTLDISTMEGAASAQDIINRAIVKVNTARADVGVMQSRFDFASQAIELSAQNQDAARAVFLDTDVAEESAKVAQAQVKMNAGISMLAQANQLAQGLLKLMQ